MCDIASLPNPAIKIKMLKIRPLSDFLYFYISQFRSNTWGWGATVVILAPSVSQGFSPTSFGLSEGPGPALEGPAQVLTDGLHQGRNEQVMCLIVFLQLYFREK